MYEKTKFSKASILVEVDILAGGRV